MIDKAKLFNQTVGRLADVYKDSPAQLEAMNSVVSACRALMEETAFDTDIITKPKRAEDLKMKPQDVKAGTGTPAKEMAPSVSPRSLKGAENTMVKAAKQDPVEVKKWSDDKLDTAIRDGAIQKFGNFTDDPMKMLDDAVSGKLDKDVEKLDKQIAKDEDKRAKKEGKAFVKNMEKLDSLKRQTNDYARKEEEAKGAVDERKAEQDQLAAARDTLKAAGNDKAAELIQKGMDQGKIGRGLSNLKDKAKEKLFGWLKKRSEAAKNKLDDAINKKDTTGISEAMGELEDIKVICEASDIDIESILG